MAVQAQEWLSVKEAAAYLRVGKSTVYNLMQSGALPWYTLPGVRGRWLKREELDRLRQRQP